MNTSNYSRDMRRYSYALAAFVLAMLLLMVGAPAPTRADSPAATDSPDSHGRLGQLYWSRTTGNTVEFRAIVGARRSYYTPLPTVGSTVNITPIYYGDGTSSDSAFLVTFVDVANDYFIAEKVVTHTYAGSGPYTAYLSDCCRLGTTNGHINNPDQSFRLETIVNLAATTASPRSSLPAIIDCPRDAVCTFQIAAIDPDNQTMRFRMGTAAEAGDVSFVQPGPPDAPNAATISSSGRYTWNTTGATLSSDPNTSTFYSTHVIIENLNAAGNVVTKTPIDFFIRLGSTGSSNRPPEFYGRTPVDGTAFIIGVGNYLAMRVDARDLDTADNVTLAIINMPAGAAFQPGAPANPVSGLFTWTPTSAQIGQYVLNFTATDPSGSSDLVSITVNVVNYCAPYFVDVHSGPNPPQDYFYEPVQVLFCNGVVSGYTEPDGLYTFRPFANTTRAQLSKMAAIAAGINDPVTGQMFTDVPSTHNFYLWIQRLAQRGHISGYSCGGPSEPCDAQNRPYFRYGASITRGQIAKILANAKGLTGTPTGQTFTDVPSTNPFYLWIERIAAVGEISGYPCGGPGEPCDAQNRPYFRWNNNAIRAQVAKMVRVTFYP